MESTLYSDNMRVLNLLKALHERTRSERQSGSNIGLTKRMYCRAYEINRIGKSYDDDKREDISTEFILTSYLARKVFVNEKFQRSRYYDLDEYHNELNFTKGLWKIYSTEVFNEVLPELQVPTTYLELEKIFMNRNINLKFKLYPTVKSAVIHSTLSDSKYCRTIKDFDLFCCLPGIPGWTSVQHGASLVDGRREAPQRLFQCSMGMYRYDHLNANEPYKNFWKEQANLSLTKALTIWEDSYITKFRNGTMYDLTPLPERFIPVGEFKWNIKRT